VRCRTAHAVAASWIVLAVSVVAIARFASGLPCVTLRIGGVVHLSTRIG
jgi:hypothetical protein